MGGVWGGERMESNYKREQSIPCWPWRPVRLAFSSSQSTTRAVRSGRVKAQLYINFRFLVSKIKDILLKARFK